MTVRSWLRRVLVAALIGVVAYTLIDLVAQVSWASIWDAMELVTWWQVLGLLLLVTVKQTLNAAPLSLFIPGLSIFRATVNDQSATLVMMVAPPPATWCCDSASSPPGESRQPQPLPGP